MTFCDLVVFLIFFCFLFVFAKKRPVNPASADWSKHYPEIFQELPSDATKPVVTIADVGCGYGGLLGS
jgi:hypothetical protein